MADSSVRLIILMTLLLRLSHAQTDDWSRATFSDTPNINGIYGSHSNFGYMLQKGETFQPTIKIMVGSKGSLTAPAFDLDTIWNEEGKKLYPDVKFRPPPIEIRFQANLQLYTRDLTYLGSTNLFYQSTSGLNLLEMTYEGLEAVDFYIDIPGCGRQRFTKSKSAWPVVLFDGDGVGLKGTWNIVNHSSPECPEVYGVIQFPTDQANLDQYYILYYRIEKGNDGSPSKRAVGDFVVPSDENNVFYVADVDLFVGDFLVGDIVLE